MIRDASHQTRGDSPCRRRNGERVYVLADLNFYSLTIGPTLLHHSATSSGMAAHIDEPSAIENAWRELVERDAFLRWWYSKASAARLAELTLDRLGSAVARHLQRDGWHVSWYSTGAPRRPVVMAVARHGDAVAV